MANDFKRWTIREINERFDVMNDRSSGEPWLPTLLNT